ncbi:MAG: amidohydrolase family protein, partial [Microcoleus sp. T3-bin5]|nr:amidohydrolase family protein [Microcoleus sp. T3-bin5]
FMVQKSLAFFQAVSLIALASAVAIAQNGQPSRSNAQSEQIVPSADHHQHVFSPAYVEKFLPPGSKTITAQDLIGLLDNAGIRRAVLLANGYSFGRPGSEPPDEYGAVKAENDWAAVQAALFPKRLIAFCGFNPLKEYALDELARCAKNPNLRHGIKLHFGSSDVQTEIPEHFEKMKRVFQAANKRRMAIIVHMRASISKKRPYGPEQARAFLELLSFAPDIPVQIAHLASSGPGYVDPAAHSVIEVLADAISKKDRRTRKLWFDVASNAHPRNPQETSELLVNLIRKIGVKRILYGTDSALGNNLRPRESWEAFRRLKLSEKEIKTVARNVAPYFR